MTRSPNAVVVARSGTESTGLIESGVAVVPGDAHLERGDGAAGDPFRVAVVALPSTAINAGASSAFLPEPGVPATTRRARRVRRATK